MSQSQPAWETPKMLRSSHSESPSFIMRGRNCFVAPRECFADALDASGLQPGAEIIHRPGAAFRLWLAARGANRSNAGSPTRVVIRVPREHHVSMPSLPLVEHGDYCWNGAACWSTCSMSIAVVSLSALPHVRLAARRKDRAGGLQPDGKTERDSRAACTWLSSSSLER